MDAPAREEVPVVPQQGVEQGPRPEVATPPAAEPVERCNLEGTEAWKNASASQKKLLDECRRQQQAPR